MAGIVRRPRVRREGIREGLTIVVAAVAACAAGAAALSTAHEEEEGWTSTAVVRAASPGEPLRSVATARRALDAAGARREDAAELLDHLTTARGPAAASFTVRADEPVAARRLAAAYARAWADAEARRSARQAGGAPPATPRVTAAEPVQSDLGTARAALLGAAVGLLAGLLLAFVRERLDIRRTSSASVAARLGFGELGRVPEVPPGVEQEYRLPALESPDGAAAEAYERLAVRVGRAARAASARVVAVCGTVVEDRGDRVAAGLAAALAGEGQAVAVAELDPSRPTLRRQFALSRGPGASEVARGEATLEEALTPVQGIRGLAVLTAGAGRSPDADAATKVLEALQRRFDMVVLAGPPLLAGGKPALPGVDAVVLAVALRGTRHSRRPRLEGVLENLGVPVLGFVLIASGGEARPGVSAGLSAPHA
jgi:Mrp family chromosome partitioning ATPase